MSDPGFDPRRQVLLPFELRESVTVRGGAAVQVEGVQFAAHRLLFETVASEPSLVTVAQTFYPAWHAYVDGNRTALWRANHAFQALQVPAGRHRVELVYEDGKLRWGAVISVTTLLVCAGLMFRSSGDGGGAG